MHAMSYQLRSRDIIVCYDESDTANESTNRKNVDKDIVYRATQLNASAKKSKNDFVPCRITDLSTCLENVNLNPNIFSKFSPKAARKYPLNTHLNSIATFAEEPASSEREHDLKSFVPDSYFEKFFVHDLNCKICSDNDYNLNWARRSQTDFVFKKSVSKSDVARYASYLPRMTNETASSSKSSSELKRDKSKDFFDDATMELVRHNLFKLSSIEGMVTGGPPSAITFHSSVKARRVGSGGKINLLLQWSPENMVSDTWVTEDELFLNSEKTIPVSQLPHEALQSPVMDVLQSTGILPRPGKRKRK